MIKKRKKISVIGSLALIFALAVSGGACGKEEEKEPPLPEQESAGGYTIQYDLPEDGSLPSEHTGIENIGYLSKNLMGKESYSVDMTSSVSALGGLYEQKVESYKDYRDGVLIATDIATSSLVNSATQCCFIGESVFMRGAKSNKVKDWKGRETEFSTADPQHYALSAYMQTYGLSSKEFSVYILNADTLLSSSEAEKLPDGNYSQTVTLDTVEAASFYRVRMKTMGALAALPEMQSITATFTFDEAWNLLSTRYVEKYNIQKGPLSLSCTADTTSVYRYGEADISAYENFFSRYETVTKPDPDVVPEAPERGVADYLSDAFSSLLIEETAFDLALRVGETEKQAHLSLDIADGVTLKADLGGMKIAYIDNKLHLKRQDLQGYIDAQSFLSKLSPDAGAAQAEETESALSSLDLDSLLEQLSEGEFIKNEDGSARLKSELALGSLTLPLEISFIEQEGVAYLKDLKTSLSLDGTEIFVTLLPSEQIAEAEGYLTERNLTPYADYIFDYILDKSFALDLKYSSGDISFAGELNVTDGCLRLDLSAKAMGATADVTAYLKEEKIYLTLHTLNGRAFEKNYCVETNSVSELIGALTPEGEEGGLKIGKLIEALLSFDLDRNIRFYPDDFGVLTSLWLDDLTSALSLPVSLGKGDIRFYEGGLRGSFGPISFRLLPGKEVILPEAAYTSLDNLILDSKEFLRFVTNEELALTLSATLQGRQVKAEILMGGNICGEGTIDKTPFVFVYGASAITIAFPSAEATVCIPLELLSGGDSALSGIEIDLARLIDAFIDNFKKIEDDSCLLKFTTSLGGALGVDSLQLKVFDNRVKGWISHFGFMGIWGENVLFELTSTEGKRVEIPSYLRYYHLTSSMGLTFEGDISGIRASAKAQITFGEKTAILMAITLEAETATLREDRAKTLYAKFDGERITLVLPQIGSEVGTLFTGTLDELSSLTGDSLSGNISVNIGSLVAGLISSLRVEEEGRLSFSAFGVSLNCQIGSGNIAVNLSDIATEGLELRGVKIGVLPYRAVSVGYPSSTALAAYTKVTMQDILDIADIVTDESGVQISFSYDFISFTARVQEGEVTGFIETKNGLGEVENTILFRYDGEKIYLVVNGNTYLSATLDELLSLIRDIELTPSSGNVPAAYRAADEQTTQLSSVIDILKRLLSSDLSFIGISRGEENALQITLSVNELLTSVVGEEIDLLPKGTVLSLTAREGAVTGEIGKRTENDEIVVGDFSLAPVKNPAEPPAGEEPDEEPDKEPDPFIELDKTMSEALEGESFASLDKLVASGIDKTVSLLLSQNYYAELRAAIDGIPVCADVLLRTDTFDLAAALTIGADKLHLNAVCGKQGARIAIQELNVLLTADENNLQELWDKLGINSLAGDMDTAQVVSAALGLLQKLTLDDEGGLAVDLDKFYRGLSVSGKIAKEDGSVLLSLGENFALEGLPVSATLALKSGEGKEIALPDTADYTVVTYQDGKELYDFVTKCISEGWSLTARVEGIDLVANYDQAGNISVTVTAKEQTLTLVYDKIENRVAILTGNLRLSAGVEQVKAFVESFLSQEETPSAAETVSQAVQTILSLDWNQISVTNDGQIVVKIALDELLREYVTLKNCDLTIGATGEKLTAELSYGELSMTAALEAGGSEVERVDFENTVSLDTLIAERLPAFIELISSENLSITLTGEASGISVHAQASVIWQEELAVAVRLTIENETIYLCYGEGVRVILPELNTQITCTAEEVNGLLNGLFGESESGETDYAEIAATVLDLLGSSKAENGEFRLNLTKYIEKCEVAFSLSANGELTARVDEFTYSDIALQATLTISSGEGKEIALPETEGYTVVTYQDGKELYDFVTKCISEGVEVNFTYEGIAATLLVDKNGTMLVTLDMGGKTIELWCDLAEEEKKVIFSVDQVHMKIELDDLYAFLRGAAQEVYGEGEQAESVAAQMTALVKEILNKDILSLLKIENTQDALSLRVAIHELLNAFDIPMQGEALLEVSFVRTNTPHLCVQLQMDGLEKPVSLRLYRAGGRTVMPVTGDIIDLNREDVSFGVTFDSYLEGNSDPRFHVSASVQLKNGNMKDGNWIVEENGQRLTLLEQFKRLYLAIDLTLTRGEGATETDDDLYMKITVAEGDLYVSASRYADGVAEKKPLRLSIGTQEMGEILGIACKLLGVETDFFDEFLKGNEVFQNKLSAFIGDGIDIKGVLQELIFSALTSSGEGGAAASVSELIVKNLNYNVITPNIPSESEYISASDAIHLVEMLVNTAVYQPQGEENYAVETSYHVEGVINASLGSLSLEKVPTQIGVEILENEKGEVSGVDINIHLSIGYFLGAINADTETNLTIHIPFGGEGKVMISRTTTEGLIFKKNYNVVREMSLDYFFSHIKAQLKFILNTSSVINSQIGEDGDSSESAPNALDYGNYLETFEQTNGGFHIVLNGHNLTNGVLGDLDLTIGYGADNTLNRLQFKTNISVLNLSADLSYPSASENFVTSLDNTRLFAEKVNLPTEVDGKKLDYWEYHVTNGKLLGSHYETPSIAIAFDTSGLPVEGYKRKGDSYQKTVNRDLGSVYELPAIEGTIETAEGKKYFVGWSTDGRKENILSEITVPLEGITLYAVWGDVYTTTVIYGDREDQIIEVLDTNTQEIVLAEGTVISADKTKYLVGWTLSDGREVAPDFAFLPSGNLTATAIWKDITLTLVTEYPLDGKTEILLSDGVKYGESYALGYQNKLTEDGEYLLAYWTTAPNGAGERVETVIPVAGNLTVYAYWKNAKTYYHVTIDLGGITLSAQEGTLWEAKTYDRLLAENVVLPQTGQISADRKHYLYAWTDGVTEYPSGGAVTPTSETVTYTAIWKKVYAISVESKYGATYQTTVVEDIDNTITLEKVGTLFEGRKILSAWAWEPKESVYDTTKPITVLEDVAFTATWVDYYKITYHDSFDTLYEVIENSGTAGKYALRAAPDKSAQTAENEKYTFLGWWLERDGAWIQATSDNLAPGSTTLTAMWAKVKYDGSLSGSHRMETIEKKIGWTKYYRYKYYHNITAEVHFEISGQIADRVTCNLDLSYSIYSGTNWFGKQDEVKGTVNRTFSFTGVTDPSILFTATYTLQADNLTDNKEKSESNKSWTYESPSWNVSFTVNG